MESNFSIVPCRNLFLSILWASVSILFTKSFLHFVNDAFLSYITHFFFNKKQNSLGRVMTQIRYNGQEKFSCSLIFRRVVVTLHYKTNLLKPHANRKPWTHPVAPHDFFFLIMNKGKNSLIRSNASAISCEFLQFFQCFIA